MGCCSKEMIERLKTFSHASVLASQAAHLTGVKQAIVKKSDKSYGEYYQGISYDEAKEKELKILLTHTKTGKWKPTPKGVAEVLD